MQAWSGSTDRSRKLNEARDAREEGRILTDTDTEAENCVLRAFSTPSDGVTDHARASARERSTPSGVLAGVAADQRRTREMRATIDNKMAEVERALAQSAYRVLATPLGARAAVYASRAPGHPRTTRNQVRVRGHAFAINRSLHRTSGVRALATHRWTPGVHAARTYTAPNDALHPPQAPRRMAPRAETEAEAAEEEISARRSIATLPPERRRRKGEGKKDGRKERENRRGEEERREEGKKEGAGQRRRHEESGGGSFGDEGGVGGRDEMECTGAKWSALGQDGWREQRAKGHRDGGTEGLQEPQFKYRRRGVRRRRVVGMQGDGENRLRSQAQLLPTRHFEFRFAARLIRNFVIAGVSLFFTGAPSKPQSLEDLLLTRFCVAASRRLSGWVGTLYTGNSMRNGGADLGSSGQRWAEEWRIGAEVGKCKKKRDDKILAGSAIIRPSLPLFGRQIAAYPGRPGQTGFSLGVRPDTGSHSTFHSRSFPARFPTMFIPQNLSAAGLLDSLRLKVCSERSESVEMRKIKPQ
ncbi:hypothetical protein B0H16DRAFT_1450066 [Mycena metata]|uniref:Uncharacterized protein n=1 Tax=Mycena metata TaxID=1033252 RepID=A0AAD7NUF8_9AGAR|nr:hypothetical protein B0H16DRAFT_1450066 [Mycena metata]